MLGSSRKPSTTKSAPTSFESGYLASILASKNTIRKIDERAFVLLHANAIAAIAKMGGEEVHVSTTEMKSDVPLPNALYDYRVIGICARHDSIYQD